MQSLLQGELYLWQGCCSGRLSAGIPEAVLKDLKAISKLCGDKENTCQKLEWATPHYRIWKGLYLHVFAWPFRGSLCLFLPCSPNHLANRLLQSKGDVLRLILVCPSESTVPSKKSFKAHFAAGLPSKHEGNMSHSNANYWLLRISLSNSHTLISKAIYGAIIWANTVHVTENPLMMMNSGYCWLQSDMGWWVRGKTLALELCGFFFVKRSGFHKSSSKMRKKVKLEMRLRETVGK